MMRWLVCTVGITRIHVPTDAVEIITEYLVGPPPPLVSHYIAGIGVLDDARLAVSVRVGFRKTMARRTARGVVLVTPRSALHWVFEVDGTVGMITRPAPESLTSEPGWLARSPGGERFLDVAAMTSVLEQT